MKSLHSRRCELLAGYRGLFESKLVNRAIENGNLDQTLLLVREIARYEPVRASEIREHELALEFLEEFGHLGGFDEYVADLTDNTTPQPQEIEDLSGWSTEAILTMCGAATG